jgi:hypothetical protein
VDDASVDCLEQFRFIPAAQDGQPVEIDGAYEMSWH